MSLSGSNDTEKLKELGKKPYKQQAIWFLNAFWKSIFSKPGEPEKVWNYHHKAVALDTAKKEDGCHLDEFQAHRLLESIGDTHTVVEMREKLKEVGIETAKLVPLTNFLIFNYKADWHALVNAAQGDNQEEVAEAQRKLQGVQEAFIQVQKTAEEAAAREKDAKAAELASKQAQQELVAAGAELKAQEDAYNNKKADLERRSQEGGVVAMNKAKAELATLLAEDPLPLRRAKISNDAAIKKAEKAVIASQEATAAAAAAKAAADASVEDAKRQVDEAEKFLEYVRNKPGSAQGALWWIDRELHEARAYLPTTKGGYTKPK